MQQTKEKVEMGWFVKVFFRNGQGAAAKSGPWRDRKDAEQAAIGVLARADVDHVEILEEPDYPAGSPPLMR